MCLLNIPVYIGCIILSEVKMNAFISIYNMYKVIYFFIPLHLSNVL